MNHKFINVQAYKRRNLKFSHFSRSCDSDPFLFQYPVPSNLLFGTDKSEILDG